MPLLSVLSLAGALIGGTVLLRTSSVALKPIIGGLVVALLIVLFLKPDAGLRQRQPGRMAYIAGAVVYLMIQILAGFFGGGTGTLIFYTLMLFFGVTIIQVAATQTVPFIILTVSSTILFASHGIIDYTYGLALMAGTAVGGYVGAYIAIRSGERWVRRLFAVLVIIVAVKLLFF